MMKFPLIYCITLNYSGVAMIVKIIVLALLVVVTVNLFAALRSLVRNKADDKRKVVKFLALRVGFSAALLLFLGLSMFMGWIEPHGLTGL